MRNLKKQERIFGQPKFRHVLPSFWLVAREYAIVLEEHGSSLEKIVVEEERPAEPYVPVQEPDLFSSFARLAARGRPSNKSILSWVRKYGLLCKIEDNEATELPDGKLNQAPMPTNNFIEEVLEARSLLDLYTDLSEGGIDALRKRIGELSEKYRKFEPLSDLDHYLINEWADEADKVGQRDPSDFFPFRAMAELETRVVGKVEKVRPTLYSDYTMTFPYGRYKVTSAWTCPDLMSAMYLQLFLWITEGVPMRRCAIPTCRTPFPWTRKDKNVCSDSCRSNLRRYPELQKRR